MRQEIDRYGFTMHLCREVGIVRRNIDPDQDGEIRVESHSSGFEYIESTGTDSGFFSPPTVGDLVLVEALDGDADYLVATSPYRGGETGQKDIPDCFKREVPTNRGWVTPGDLLTQSEADAADSIQGKPETAFGGHKFELDDGRHTYDIDSDKITERTKKSKGARITTSGGNKIHIYEEESDVEDGESAARNYIKIESVSGHNIIIDEDSDKITLESTGDAKIIIDASGKIQIQAGEIEIGDASLEYLMKGDTFKTWIDNYITAVYNAHQHPTPMGPSGVPTLTGTVPPAGCYSTQHKVE